MSRRQFAAWLWYAVLWCPCYAISRVWFRYRFFGKNHVPLTGPVLLVSNHQSNLDPVLVGLACPRQLKYLARKGLFFFPLNLWIRAGSSVNRSRGQRAGRHSGGTRIIETEQRGTRIPRGFANAGW